MIGASQASLSGAHHDTVISISSVTITNKIIIQFHKGFGPIASTALRGCPGVPIPCIRLKSFPALGARRAAVAQLLNDNNVANDIEKITFINEESCKNHP